MNILMYERARNETNEIDREGSSVHSPRRPTATEKLLPQPTYTFADIIAAVERAPDLTQGVRRNLRSSVERMAALMGAAGPTAVVDVAAIARRLESVTAAKLGFRSENSLAAFRSNLRRALRMAGVTIMAGKASAPLTLEWAALAGMVASAEPFLWPALSRFAHYASAGGWSPAEVGPPQFARFAEDLRETCLMSKVEKTIRGTASAWVRAQALIPAWPAGQLPRPTGRRPSTLLPWSEFPRSFEADARRFVARGESDWLTESAGKPLKPRTQSNYLDAIRRVASLLVTSGAAASGFVTLADIVVPALAEKVLRSVQASTGRNKGGHVGFIAMLLLSIGRDHVGLTGKPLDRLASLFKKTNERAGQMSNRTLDRLVQFDAPTRLDELLRLPAVLMTLADARPKVDIRGAKLARTALYLALLLETCGRSGNMTGIDLDRHLHLDGTGKKARTFVVIAGQEVKNGVDIRAQLTPQTVKLLRRYIDRYRVVHASVASSWLFPRADGSHWTVVQACADLKDIVARHVGADITPHLCRSLAGKIMLDARPGAHALVQQLLGHKSLQTTLSFYTRFDQMKTRSDFHAVLSERRQ